MQNDKAEKYETKVQSYFHQDIGNLRCAKGPALNARNLDEEDL